MTPRTDTLSGRLGEFIQTADPAAIPPAVQDRVMDDLVDITGCVAFGFRTPWGRAVTDHVASLAEPYRASVWASDVRGNSSSVALALGTLGHSFDFDDYHPGAKLHPATVVIPAAVPLAEDLHSSGTELLVATTLGMEVMIRLALASGSVATMLNGFHLTGICGSVGAAAAAARLLGLDARQTADALGLAASQAAGLMGFLHDGSESKRLHAGRAAHNGIVAAQLAARGFTGPPRAFELEHGGFCHAFSTDPHPERIVEGLGERWTAGEVSFKRYSCCGSIHSTLDLVTQAVRELGVGADQVDRIEVHHSPAVIAQCGWRYEPSDVLHAQMSLQYCIAVLLLTGSVLPDQFRDELLGDPDVLAVAAKVSFTADPEIERLYPEKFAAHVVVHAGGESRELRTEHPKGAAANPLTQDEVDEKFHQLAGERLDAEQRAHFLKRARALHELDDVAELVGGLRITGVEQ